MQEIVIYYQTSSGCCTALRNKIGNHPITQHIRWVCVDQSAPNGIYGTPTAVQEGRHYVGDKAVSFLTEEMAKLN
jgi:hypothetical protein